MFGLLDAFIGGIEDPSKGKYQTLPEKYIIAGIVITIIIYSIVGIVAWQLSKKRNTQSDETDSDKGCLIDMLHTIGLVVIVLGRPIGVFSLVSWFAFL